MMKLSVTSADEWMTCRRRWYLSHVEGWEPWAKSANLVSGVLFHKWVAKAWSGQDVRFVEDEGELLRCDDPGFARARARAGLRIWRNEIPGTPSHIESDFQVEKDGIIWRGRIDGIVEDSGLLYVVDHKLVSMPKFDWFQGISDQLVMYAALLRWVGIEVVGGYWDLVLVPSLRKKVREELQEFEDRLVEEGNNRGGVVVLPVTWTEDDLREAEEKIMLVGEEVQRGKIFRNPSACWRGCPYTVICRDSSRAGELGFVKREEVTDLGGEGENE